MNPDKRKKDRKNQKSRREKESQREWANINRNRLQREKKKGGEKKGGRKKGEGGGRKTELKDNRDYFFADNRYSKDFQLFLP